jgi:hypothetical protein|tara:strand:- start:594 stop:884 length:291 start_codon:yes stop_codon:yes gene_type:complete
MSHESRGVGVEGREDGAVDGLVRRSHDEELLELGARDGAPGAQEVSSRSGGGVDGRLGAGRVKSGIVRLGSWLSVWTVVVVEGIKFGAFAIEGAVK